MEHTLEVPITREAYYREQGVEPPATSNGHGTSGRRCQGCGTSLEGRRPEAKWCSDPCRKRARNGRTGTRARRGPRSAAQARTAEQLVEPLEPARGGALLDDLVVRVAASEQVVAVTVEYAAGVSVTVART